MCRHAVQGTDRAMPFRSSRTLKDDVNSDHPGTDEQDGPQDKHQLRDGMVLTKRLISMNTVAISNPMPATNGQARSPRGMPEYPAIRPAISSDTTMTTVRFSPPMMRLIHD